MSGSPSLLESNDGETEGAADGATDPSAAEITYDPSSGSLSIVGGGRETVPLDVLERYRDLKQLDLSHNALTDVSPLTAFQQLDTLILDDNLLTSRTPLPLLPNLRTLWLNSNDIKDLAPFLEAVRAAFPSLTYLSLLKNVCCPNFFVGKDQDDYQRYRYYVVYMLPRLTFLDASPVSDAERSEASRVGKYCGTVARPAASSAPPPRDVVYENLRALPQDLREASSGAANFGVSRQQYVGRLSEGNRFILNSDL